MKKYLVTGGCGFIGSHLVEDLVQKGHDVRVIDDLSNSSIKYLPTQVEFIAGSICDDPLLRQALEGVDGIFHLAARVSVPESTLHWQKNHLINCSATIRILELAKTIPIVFASSAAVYGNSQQLPHYESAPPLPLSPYAVDKWACEQHAKVAWEQYRTPSVACRFFNVYGPRQNPLSPYAGVISKFLDQLVHDQPVTIYGDGTQERDFIYVQDVVAMMATAMQKITKGAHVYNFCTGQPLCINQVVDLMGGLIGCHPTKNYTKVRAGDIVHSYGDPSKVTKELGVGAQISFNEGLAQLIQSHHINA